MNRYIAAIKRMNVSLKGISKQYGFKAPAIWLDALISFVLYGVTPNQYIGFGFYKMNGRMKRTFYTARHQSKYDKIFNDPQYAEIFWDKQKFNSMFRAFVSRKWIYTPDVDTEQIGAFLKENPKVIIKPTSLSSGRGVHVYKGEESAEDLKNGKFLIEEFCVQHSQMSKLNPSSVNTVRLYTALDKDHNPHILSAMIRVGGQGAEVDNYHSGGVGYPIDIDTGYVCGPGADLHGRRFLKHPGTDAKVIGFEVPNFAELKEFVFKATQVIKEARLIAWDVCVLEDGFELIEANYDGDSGFMQSPLQQGRRKEIMSLLKKK